MNYEIILECVVRVVAILVMGWLAPKLRAWLSANLDAKEMEMLDKLIVDFVEAAEQTIHTSGADRKAFVIDQLKKLNIEVTKAIDARIEAAVFRLPDSNG